MYFVVDSWNEFDAGCFAFDVAAAAAAVAGGAYEVVVVDLEYSHLTINSNRANLNSILAEHSDDDARRPHSVAKNLFQINKKKIMNSAWLDYLFLYAFTGIFQKMMQR